jgi:hypothetical protein
MLRPVGTLPPAVYWRRRLAVAAAIVALIAVTLYAVWPSGSKHKPAAARNTGSGHAAPSVAATANAALPAGRSVQTAAPPPATPSPCDLTKLQISATTSALTYAVGDSPTLYLQVVNPGPTQCVVDLSDQQILMQVYNGQSRVWGSHDCQVQPGTTPRTLPVSVPVRVGVRWSGLSSEAQCAGTRQRVPVGIYTLYVQLAGADGKVSMFTIK